jgi:hypothetical protein
VPKIYPSLSGLETSADVFFGHLRETEGGFIISVLRYWHAFDFPLLRAQYLRKRQGTIMWLRVIHWGLACREKHTH